MAASARVQLITLSVAAVVSSMAETMEVSYVLCALVFVKDVRAGCRTSVRNLHKRVHGVKVRGRSRCIADAISIVVDLA